MKVKSIEIKNLKGFIDSGSIELSPTINLLVGANNSGKSTVIKACYLLQCEMDIPRFPRFANLRNNRVTGICNSDKSTGAARAS